MASGCVGDQGLLEAPEEGDRAWSFEVDLRSCWPNVTDRGLRGKPDFGPDEEDGELDSLMLRALEKLHFFDGVLRTADVDSDAEPMLA